MVTPENTNWLFDYGLIEDIAVPESNFGAPNSGFSWSMQPLNGPSNVGYESLTAFVNFSSLFLELDPMKYTGLGDLIRLNFFVFMILFGYSFRNYSWVLLGVVIVETLDFCFIFFCLLLIRFLLIPNCSLLIPIWCSRFWV